MVYLQLSQLLGPIFNSVFRHQSQLHENSTEYTKTAWLLQYLPQEKKRWVATGVGGGLHGTGFITEMQIHMKGEKDLQSYVYLELILKENVLKSQNESAEHTQLGQYHRLQLETFDTHPRHSLPSPHPSTHTPYQEQDLKNF